MWYAWYPLCAGMAAVWVLFDARRRMAARWWPLAVLLGGPAGLAAYLAVRPLREGESREGGLAWQLVAMFVVCWTALFAAAAIWNLAIPFAAWHALAIAWAVPALPALVAGFALKRSTVEHGPTGMLRAMGGLVLGARHDRGWTRLHLPRMRQGIPGHAALLRRLRAWPGQSG